MKKYVLIANAVLFAAIIGLDVWLILEPSLLLKSLASAVFVVSAAVNLAFALVKKAHAKFSILMLIGCVFAFVGDVVIYMSGDIYFIVGAALFAVAHAIYVAAYYCLTKFRLTDVIFSACVFVASLLVITLAPIFDFGGVLMEVVCAVYALLLSLMVGKALSSLRSMNATVWLIAIASILFFVSDFALLINMFSAYHKVPRIICLVTYYPAQFLLAFSLFVCVDDGFNVFKAVYCRIFQTVFKIALPLLPYKNPQILEYIKDIAGAIKSNGRKKPLIVTDKTIYGLGLCTALEESLKAEGIDFCVYSDVVANPTTDNVDEALKLYKENDCDCLVAFGGGSPMDCAKGVGALIARPKKTLNDLGGILKVGRKIPLLIAVPTTAGTGSETTLACVIVDSKTRHKYAVNDFPLIPEYAVLDEEVTMTLPQKVVSTTGIDALTHAIEAYIGRSGNGSTRRDALEAIDLIFNNIEISYFEKTREARRNMLIASHKAGRAFSKAYVGYVHAVAHSLGGRYDTPHGLANAVILPTVLKEYGKAAHKKLKSIAVYCGLADEQTPAPEAAERVISKIKELNAKFGIPETFDFIKREDIAGLAAYADKEANPLYPVPKLWNEKQLEKIYFKVGGYAD